MLQGIKEENMKPWKLHWDIQLYKALEHQYQLGLEVLNENLPEIKVELVFRWIICSIREFLLFFIGDTCALINESHNNRVSCL